MARLKTKRGRAPTARMAASHSLRPRQAIYYGTSKRKQNDIGLSKQARSSRASIAGGQKKEAASKEEGAEMTPKRGRGRPRKVTRPVGRPRKSDMPQVGRPKKEAVSEDLEADLVGSTTPKRGPGRPRKNSVNMSSTTNAVEILTRTPRPRGRPPKGGNTNHRRTTSTLAAPESRPSTRRIVKRGRDRPRCQKTLGLEGPKHNALPIRDKGGPQTRPLTLDTPAAGSHIATASSGIKRGRGRPRKNQTIQVETFEEPTMGNTQSKLSAMHPPEEHRGRSRVPKALNSTSYSTSVATDSNGQSSGSVRESSMASAEHDGQNGFDISTEAAPMRAKTAENNSDSRDNDPSGDAGAGEQRKESDVVNEGVPEISGEADEGEETGAAGEDTGRGDDAGEGKAGERRGA